MHSRIFQVSTQPIPSDEYLSDCYDDHFFNTSEGVKYYIGGILDYHY